MLLKCTYHDLRALEEREAALEAAVETAQDAFRVVEAQYRVGLVARDKLREAEAALAEAQANLYDVKCQHAAPHSTEGRASNYRESGRLAEAFPVRGKRGRFFKLSAGLSHRPASSRDIVCGEGWGGAATTVAVDVPSTCRPHPQGPEYKLRALLNLSAQSKARQLQNGICGDRTALKRLI